MNELRQVIDEALHDFERVVLLAKASIVPVKIEWEILDPHRPPTRLPDGKMAIYAFFLNDQALKVGKAGPKSAARYCYQHYNPASAISTLAASILKKPSVVGLDHIESEAIGKWIQDNTQRVNLLVPMEVGPAFLGLLEAFLHFRWAPVFEGRAQSI